MTLLVKLANMEDGLRRLQSRLPELPYEEMFTARLLVHLGRALAALSDQNLKPYGLVEIEFHVLMNVHGNTENGRMTYPVDLCTRLTQSPTNMTRVIESMVQRDLLSRQPDASDRRKMGLQTTPKAEQLVATLLPIMFESTRATFQDMSPDELKELNATLKNLAGMLDRKAAADGQTETAESA